MRTRTRTSIAGVVGGVILTLLLGLLPAYASHTALGTTGSVNVRDILAGAVNQPFNVTITHDAGASNPIPGQGTVTRPIEVLSFQAPGGYVINTITPPAGKNWNFTRGPNASIAYLFAANPASDGVAAGSNQVFVVSATNSVIPGRDKTGSWFIQAADNPEGAMVDVQGGANLQTTTRVLKADSLTITAPGPVGDMAGVTDGSATVNQSGVQFTGRLANVGSAAQTVTPTLTPKAASDFSCSAASAVTIPAGGLSSPILFNCTMGSAAKASDATLGGSSSDSTIIPANAKTTPITIQAAPNFVYVAGSLDPKAVPPNTPVSFKLQVTQNASGAAKVFLDPASTTLSFSTFTASLKARTPITPGQTALLEFETKNTPALPAGKAQERYTVSLNVGGQDDNTMAFSATPSVTDQIKVDLGIPTVTVTITPPASLVADQPAAVTNGSNLGFSGSIKDDQGTGTPTDCGPPTCTIESAFLRQFADAGCTGAVAEEKTVAPSNTGGTIGGNYTGSYNAAAKSVQLVVTAKDDVTPPNRGTGTSNCVDVDLIAPRITGAVTGIDALTNRRTQIRVSFSEPVVGPCNVNDWTVDDNVVIGCSAGPQANKITQVTLTVATEFLEDYPPGQAPELHYQPSSTTGAFKDRVGLPVPPIDLSIVDGIVPDSPLFDTLTTNSATAPAYGSQDGAYYTNLDAPTVRLINVEAPGHIGEIWRETGSQEGLQRSGANADVKVGQATRNTPADPNVSTDDFLLVPIDSTGYPRETVDNSKETRVKTYAVVADTGQNVSVAAEALFVVDKLNPTVGSAEAQANKVVVTAREPLARGRNAPIDWTVCIQTCDGEFPDPHPNTIDGTGTTRNLNMTSSAYDRTLMTSLEFLFVGAANQRYQDRAGNQLGDFSATPSGAGGANPPLTIV